MYQAGRIPTGRDLREIAEFIGKDTMPLNMVTMAGFRALGMILDKRNSTPSGTYFGQVTKA